MKKISLILAMAALASCGGGKPNTPKGELVPCIVDSIVPIISYSIVPENKCMVYLDCGVFFSERCGRSKIGDTIYLHKRFR